MREIHPQASAFVLHSRAFQENSLILQLFSLELGRFSVVAKGIKSKRSQARRALLQPFNEILIDYVGKNELKTLTHCQLVVSPQRPVSVGLQGKALACGFYANELILRALPEYQDNATLFDAYRQLVNALSEQVGSATPSENALNLSPILREFEMSLLAAMGILPDCRYDLRQDPILPDGDYRLLSQQGFERVDAKAENIDGKSVREPAQKYTTVNNLDECFSGRVILSLADGKPRPEDARAGQRITALLLREVIGDKPLQSRKLWQHMSLNRA